MSIKKVDEYAAQHGLSNRQAKKRLGKARGETIRINIVRGSPVAGTGKPKGASK
jgi:hypothetical protein